MLRKGTLIAIGIVLAANAATLALVALNRSGEPEASVQLTERELRLPERGMEDTGISLSLTWRRPSDVSEDDLPLFSWFDRAKLESIGFDCRVAPDDRNADRHYSPIRQPGRFVYAVLAYRPDQPTVTGARPAGETTGPGADISATQAPSTARPGVVRAPLTDADRARLSRLVPVDVGLDAAALRKTYPDRRSFVIVQASARVVFYRAAPGKPPRLAGSLNYVMPAQIFVPGQHRPLLDRLTAAQPTSANPYERLDHDPRYTVSVKFGRNLQPWVDGVGDLRKQEIQR